MFLAMRKEVEIAIADALAALDLPTDDLGIEEPPADVDAVLASSVAYRLAGEVGAPPPAVAADVAAEIDPGSSNYVSDVVTEGPYLNFRPSEKYDAETLEAARKDDWGQLEPTDESVVVEHTSANPTGPIHVGRARNTIVGDAIANVLERAGYDVERHYYVNDAGRQIATLAWAYETIDEADLPEPERDRPDYDLVRYYREGNAILEDGDEDEIEAAEDEIQSIMQGLEAGDEEAYERVSEVVDRMLEGMQGTLDRLPAHFDEFVKETRFMRDGSTDDVVERLRETDHAVYEEDAWQLDLEPFGIGKKLVFTRSDGTSLYPTRDLAHHEWKLETFDRAVTVLGEDHELQAKQLRTTLELLGTDTDPLQQVFFGWVNLPEGGMSTRKGTGIDLDDLLDEAIDRAREEVETRLEDRIRDDDLTDADVERIARQVGIGAVRYDIVAKQPIKTITFDWDRALDFEAQSAPYVQYVHARCCGILDEAGDVPEAVDVGALERQESIDLLRTIARFPGVLESAAEDLEPHGIATYTREFAETFNAFYRECPVLTAEDAAVREARVALVAAARRTIAAALQTLGIEAPDSM
ncbi:MAG: arginyl-tRNA synthetase [Halobacteriales archaeon]|jgi:arginyl-tRNA synthetase